MKKVFQYKAKINKTTEANAVRWLDLCCDLYNTCLEQRIDIWKRYKKHTHWVNQVNELPNLKKELIEYKEVGSQVLVDAVRRVDRAFQNFFRRVKSGSKVPGYPRFKGKKKYDSFTLGIKAGWSLKGKYLTINKVGVFKLFLSRPIEGNIKTVTIRRKRSGDWFVCFCCDNVKERDFPPTVLAVGVDVGIKVFLAKSNGEVVENPKFLRKAEVKLCKQQQRLSRRSKGSVRQAKARKQVARTYEKVSNQRKDFINKLVLKLVSHYQFICVEKLKISNLIRNKSLSKSIADASWGIFLNRLVVAAEEAKRQVIKVNPTNTSQMCLCGEIVQKNLSVRVHRCPVCGLTMDRDILAAKNILKLGQSFQASSSSFEVFA